MNIFEIFVIYEIMDKNCTAKMYCTKMLKNPICKNKYS